MNRGQGLANKYCDTCGKMVITYIINRINRSFYHCSECYCIVDWIEITGKYYKTPFDHCKDLIVATIQMSAKYEVFKTKKRETLWHLIEMFESMRTNMMTRGMNELAVANARFLEEAVNVANAL